MGAAGARKFTDAEKLDAIKRLDRAIAKDSGQRKVRDICAEDGVGYQNYYQWKKKLGQSTTTRDTHQKPRTYRSDEEKRVIVARIEAAVAAGEFIKQAAKNEGITAQLFRDWRDKQGMGGGTAIAPVKKSKPMKATPIDLHVLQPEVVEQEQDVVVIVGKALNVAKAMAGMFQTR